jgi:ribosome maturation factor RimP
MKLTPVEQKVADIITPSIEEMGFRVVRVRLSGQDNGKTLQVMIEKQDLSTLNVDDCAKVSRAASILLEVDDPISGAYHLEVSSPGIDRPLTSFDDFIRFKGFDAKIETDTLINGRKRFKGIIKECVDDKVTIAVDGEDYDIPCSDISQSKLVLTDELIKAYSQVPSATEEVDC